MIARHYMSVSPIPFHLDGSVEDTVLPAFANTVNVSDYFVPEV
jgi:hypothetical protein